MTILDEITMDPSGLCLYNLKGEVVAKTEHTSRPVFILNSIVIKFSLKSENMAWNEIAKWLSLRYEDRYNFAPILEAREICIGRHDYVVTVHPKIDDVLAGPDPEQFVDEVWHGFYNRAVELFEQFAIGDCHTGNWMVANLDGLKTPVIIDYEFCDVTHSQIEVAKGVVRQSPILTGHLPISYRHFERYSKWTLADALA